MSRQTIAVSVKASKLTARALAYVVAAVGRKIAKEHRKAQTPHGKQSVRKLMGHGGDMVLWRSQNRWSFHSENDRPLHPLLLSRCQAGCRGKSHNCGLFSLITTKTTEK